MRLCSLQQVLVRSILPRIRDQQKSERMEATRHRYESLAVAKANHLSRIYAILQVYLVPPSQKQHRDIRRISPNDPYARDTHVQISNIKTRRRSGSAGCRAQHLKPIRCAERLRINDEACVLRQIACVRS